MQTQEIKVDLRKALDADLVVIEYRCPISKRFFKNESTLYCSALKYQNQSLKSGQHGQFLKVKSNEAKIKRDIDEIGTINIKLEHSVAKLLAENEHSNKEKDHLKLIYKDLYDYIKKTRVKTKDHTDSLIVQLNNKSNENADLKAQIQEKFFAIAALKNDLRKLKGNSVDTKFAKTSVLEKPVLHVLRNQSVVRQLNAFKSERPKISKLWNSSKNMPRFSSNDMVHNNYLDEARKKTQERYRISKPSVMPSARFQSTADDTKPKPKSTNQSTRSLPVSKSSYITIMAVPKADHSKNSSSFSDSKHFVCSTCHKIIKTVGLRWIPTRKLFDSCTGKVDSESTHGSNIDISNIHKCKQTLDLSASISINVQQKQRIDFSAEMISMTSMIELEILFGPSFDEYFNGENQVVPKPFAVTTADTSNKRQQQPDSTSSTSTLATTVSADRNFDL
uniref:Uncharacterized protein n=1 Tax=Tanacetum cinerariifolium TaxID=118510 RepID=A0A6L2MJ81_TANCI|nr:hypothetical protein [Tanacetum cinerariifolium]